MSSDRNDRNIVPGTSPTLDQNLRIKNAEREAIFDKVKTPLPYGKEERATAIATKFREIDSMIAEIATCEKMSRETMGE
ncbi:hypothetical protein PG989_003038 [Apiospora arundinis]